MIMKRRSGPEQPKQQGGEKNVGEGKRDESSPAEVHQLIVAETREHPADPDEKQHKHEDLPEKDEDMGDGAGERIAGRLIEAEEGEAPSAEKERHDHGGPGDDIGVLRKEEEEKFHRAVFGVVAADQFGLGL